MNKRQRIFIAINVPADVRKFLVTHEQKWQDLPAKWVGVENLHITMVFLGDVTDIELGEVCMAVKEVCQRHQTLDIQLEKISYGPNDKIPPKFVWAFGAQNKELALLKKDLEDSLLGKVNFMPEARLFAPHVTLARISTFAWRQIEPEERPEVNEIIDLAFTVESIEVMESELKKEGVQYNIIESYSLQ